MYTIRILCAMLACFIAVPVADSAEMTVKLAAGARGSNYYSVGGAICRMINRTHPLGCSIEPTGGARENLFALLLTDAEFAIVQADMQRAAYRGSPDIDGEYPHLRSVAAVYTEVLTIVTRADSDIEGFADLAGRRVAAGSLESGSRWTFGEVMKTLGMAEEDLADFSPRPALQGTDALCEGRSDALVMMTGHPSSILARLGELCPVRILRLAEDEIEALTGAGEPYRPTIIAAGTYPFAPEAIPTIGTDATLMTVASVPDAIVDRFLMAIFGDLDAFRRQQYVIAPALWWDVERGAPLHRAALRFYREHDPAH